MPSSMYFQITVRATFAWHLKQAKINCISLSQTTESGLVMFGASELAMPW